MLYAILEIMLWVTESVEGVGGTVKTLTNIRWS